jgi:deoxyribodipyrimidine photo-lyase
MRKINIFWFRRDLRLDDNTGLRNALNSGLPVLPVFIFDTNITGELQKDDPRISFIYERLSFINYELQKSGSSLEIRSGDPIVIWKSLVQAFNINAVYINKDYEPYTVKRDYEIEVLLRKNNIQLFRFKDQVIFEEKEVCKSDNNPYKLFTPYKNRWLELLRGIMPIQLIPEPGAEGLFQNSDVPFPSLENLGFRKSPLKVRAFDLAHIQDYDKYRDSPSEDRTTYLGPHLRFGTVSIRQIVLQALKENAVFLSELIWREFFMQILFNYPVVVTSNFKSKYDHVEWINNEEEFGMWCRGETGYPLVDAGMRQLNQTGYMHNRVRMIAAGFLCKHLLTDWRWGEAYFAQKLLDYELSSNNGNWQWAAGTGCDAAPYFRIFNPYSQQEKFDPDKEYINRWINDFGDSTYPKPMIEHNFARNRAISAYKSGLFF